MQNYIQKSIHLKQYPHNPLVSVLIPCFNQGEFIRETVLSVLAQDYTNVQIIISDDASTDDTCNILSALKKQYKKKIVLLLNQNNLGISDNIARMQNLIEGDYVCWFSGDDIMLPAKLTEQVMLMEDNPDVVYCYHDVEVFDDDDTPGYFFNGSRAGLKAHQGDIVKNLIMNRCFVSGISLMIRRSAIGELKHRSWLSVSADWLYFIELAAKGKVLCSDKVLAKYRRHETNISRQINCSDEEKVYDYLQIHYPEYKLAIAYGRVHLYFVYIFKYFLDFQWNALIPVTYKLIKAICMRPDSLIFLIKKLYDQIQQRLYLLAETGKIIR